ncbi:hypothetical protein HMPREF1977_0987 [Capnocytophaga ochracea F0287]|uniref:Uncharacterized protein n=1 Tax=Capnocytophaga ochracea F0287 TaxID=873517 RepID=E4MRC3_CAPOC|nr:hypothetical protein HMPREF1977_0987 [Capnocytophaga ochracea F0287]
MKNEALKVQVAQAVVARCEPHGQIEKRRTNDEQMTVRATQADREKTNK